MNNSKPDVPNGLDHIAFLEQVGRMTKAQMLPLLAKEELKSVGVSLNILYQAATCHRQCHGGAHVLERLCGRAYNHGCAAFHLLMLGFYDEALGLIRGIGELSNIMILAAEDPVAIQEWIHADAKTLRSKFGPAQVRKMLEAKNSQLMYATKQWYGDLSEGYIHVSPQTKPNEHSGRAWVGGAFQKEGAEKVFAELTTILCNIGLMTCKWFKFDDLFKELAGEIGICAATCSEAWILGWQVTRQQRWRCSMSMRRSSTTHMRLYLDSISAMPKFATWVEETQVRTLELFKGHEGDPTTVEELDQANFIYGVGDPDDPKARVQHVSKQGELKARNREDGANCRTVSRVLIITIYQFWEDHYRHQFAKVVDKASNEILSDFFGDVRHLRNDIIHHRNYASERVSKCKLLTYFQQGEEIYLNKEQVIEVMAQTAQCAR